MAMARAVDLILASAAMSSAATDAPHAFGRGSWKASSRPMRAADVVHFLGADRGPCRTEMPGWGKLLQERSDLNLVVITPISFRTSRARSLPCCSDRLAAARIGPSDDSSSNACGTRSIRGGKANIPAPADRA